MRQPRSIAYTSSKFQTNYISSSTTKLKKTWIRLTPICNFNRKHNLYRFTRQSAYLIWFDWEIFDTFLLSQMHSQLTINLKLILISDWNLKSFFDFIIKYLSIIPFPSKSILDFHTNNRNLQHHNTSHCNKADTFNHVTILHTQNIVTDLKHTHTKSTPTRDMTH